MSGKLDPRDREQLLASLKHWKDVLQRESRRESLRTRQEARAHRLVQQARSRIDLREKQLAKVTIAGPRRRAVREALSFVGTTEHPPGSNRGVAVDHWEARFHMNGQPWCGAFVGAMCEVAGAKLSDRIVYTPFIYDDARLHRNGLDSVVWTRLHGWGAHNHTAHSGDLVLYDFGSGSIKHVGMLVQPWHAGPLQTVEGNTSFANAGSQDNGGAVARRQRDPSLVHSIVSVAW